MLYTLTLILADCIVHDGIKRIMYGPIKQRTI